MSVRHASRSVVDALPLPRPSIYVCRQCRRNAHPSQILRQQRQYASDRTEGLPLAERVRRKLWKGKPPGPENVDDLYGGPGAIETMFKERRERQTRNRTRTRTQTQTRPEDVPAESQTPVEPLQSDMQTTESKFQQEEETRELAYSQPAREAQETRNPAQLERAKEVQESETDEDDVVDRDDPDYKQATTWDGVPIVGHKGHWKEMTYRAVDEYTPWLPLQVRKEWSYTELVSLMHQTIVECYAFKEAKIPSEGLWKLSSLSPIEQSELENATFQLSANGTIESVNGISELSQPFNDASYLRKPAKPEPKPFSYELDEAIISRTEPELRPLEPRLSYTPTDTTFLDATLELTNPSTLQIFKRFTLLMNQTIPDPLITDVTSKDSTKNTIRDFLLNMAEKTKKKDAKVAELLMKDERIAEQPNLLVLGRRETPVDKEKEVGRWKFIEEELRSRGLPVLGRVQIQR